MRRAFSPTSSIRYLVRRLVKLEFVNIHLRLFASDIPDLDRDISPLTLRQMKMADVEEIDSWLAIHNDAYEHDWGRKHFEKRIVNHPLIDTKKTFFVMDGDRAVAATSIGVWRKNTNVGVGHYAGVLKAYQSYGLGKYLFIFRSLQMREMGLEWIDNQTTLAHKKSLMVHFDVGYRLEDGPEPWTTQDFFPNFVRRIVNARARTIFEEWERHRAAKSELTTTGERIGSSKCS